MEAPTIKGEIIKKYFSIISNKGRKFMIDLFNYHYSIYIYALFEDEIKKDEFQKEYKLEDLQKIKFLSLFDTVDDIFEEIINLFEKKLSEIKLLEESYKLIINIPLEGKKITDVTLNLDLKIRNIDEKYDELYNIILKLKNENDELKKEQKRNEEEINELKKCPHPIGSVYTQYPNCKEPKELWNKTKWELLDYNGAFFRSIGGNSLDFGKFQNEGLPNIKGNKLLAWTDESGGGIIMDGRTNINDSALYSYQDSKYYSYYYVSHMPSKFSGHHNILGFNANRANHIYGNSDHVTPGNYAIKIWKRIE